MEKHAEEIASGALLRLLPGFRPVEFAINAIYPHRHHLSTKVRSVEFHQELTRL